MSRIPILWARVDSEQCLHPWCPYCAREHHHGRGAGHRNAHCDGCSASPFPFPGGYMLEPQPDKSLLLIRRHNEAECSL